jgi:hypothetical protein
MNNEAFAQAKMEFEIRKTANYGVFTNSQTSSSWILGEVIRRVASVLGVGLYGDMEASRTRIQ